MNTHTHTHRERERERVSTVRKSQSSRDFVAQKCQLELKRIIVQMERERERVSQ